MMKIAAAMLMVTGIALMTTAAVIFFVTDCFLVCKTLRTTKKIADDMDISSKTAGNIYYAKKVERLSGKSYDKPKFIRDEGIVAEVVTSDSSESIYQADTAPLLDKKEKAQNPSGTCSLQDVTQNLDVYEHTKPLMSV